MVPDLTRIILQAVRARLAGLRIIAAMLLCFSAAMIVPDIAAAATPAADTRCYAAADNTATLATWLRQTTNGGPVWRCDGSAPSIKAHYVAVKLPVSQLADQGGEVRFPRFLRGRNGLFDRLSVIAVNRDGKHRALVYPASQIQPDALDSKFSVALPEMREETEAVIAVFERPRSFAMLQLTTLLTQRPSAEPGTMQVLLLVALLCGFLLMPVIFDIVFYRALKETFVLWHAATAGLLSVHLATGGIIVFLVPMDMPTLTRLATLSFSLLLMTAIMFARAIIEPGMLHPKLRQGLGWCAVAALGLMALRLLPLEATRPYAMIGYFAGHAPILLFVAVCAVDSWRRGSRAIRFLTGAWIPFFILGMIRIATYVTPMGAPDDTVWLFRFAAIFEIVMTSIAVADRFANLRHQRDTALEEASRLVTVAERDQLTGLRNRRALEGQFDDLRFKGFDTFALLDLDKFKNVNDTHGHAAGDAVLAAIGNALENYPDRNVRAFRLGGEEFVVLLRGKRTLQRAEALRQMIPGQIAVRVEGLGAPVTASMGAVKVPRAGLLATMPLSALYARADKLLYDAKAGGRNRIVTEALTVFGRSGKKVGSAATERRSNRNTQAA